MEWLPASLYEYLALFALCLVSFLIGWFSGRRKKPTPVVRNAPAENETVPDIPPSEREVRAVQTRERGGRVVKRTPAAPHPSYEQQENKDLQKTQEPDKTAQDDLKLISGIGVVMEEKLHGIGIYRFSQLGGLTPHDIEKVTAYLGISPKKVEKENWILQAKELAAARSGNELKEKPIDSLK